MHKPTMTTSSASLRLRMLGTMIRLSVRPRLGDMRDLKRLSRLFESRSVPPPRGVRFHAEALGGVPGEWAEAGGEKPLFYLHGGGFVGCSPQTHRALTGGFALRGFRVFAPGYRLAPAHPFPAAVEDTVAAWRAFAERVGQPAVVGGDSAGGTLALSLALIVKDEPHAPAGVVLFSPATDLTGASKSWVDNRHRDLMFTDQLANLRDYYLNGADARDSRASPLFGDPTGLPPLLFHVGESEILRDDSVRFVEAAREAGVRADLKIWAHAPHVWQLLHAYVPEGRTSLNEAAAFLKHALEEAAA